MSSNTQPQRRSARLVIDCAQSVQRVEPDSKAIYAFTIENRSDEAQSQSLELRGLAPQWFSIDFDERRICFPGEQRTATIVVSVPEGAARPVNQFRFVAKAGPDGGGLR